MGKKLILKNVRFSFVRVFEAEDRFNQGKSKYEVTILIPKTDKDNIKKVAAAIKELQKEYLAEHPKCNGKLPGDPSKWNPIKDGDDNIEYDGFEGMYYIRASRNESQGRPVIIDKHKQPITQKEDFYSGCWGVASIDAYSFDQIANKGITFGLNGVQKVKDDEAFGGGGSAINDFDEEDDDTDNDPIFDDPTDEDLPY